MSPFKIPYYGVDAFVTGRPFSGNPAGVCPLEAWLPDPMLQAVAAQNNLSETAFFVKEGDGYRIRWFAPAAEVDLCGHATLASAHVLYEVMGRKESNVTFQSKSGPLKVSWEGSRLVLDFPALPLSPADAPAELLEGLGSKPRAAFRAMDWVCVFNDEEAVRSLRPRFDVLSKLDLRGVVVTAPGKDCDYVLRVFGPKLGVQEDPVTGSAQSMLAPFWAARLGKKSLSVKQLSARGGELSCDVSGDRVRIAGKARVYLKGDIQF
jgi:PhzF family phenazine biosynthesis protein